MMVEVGRSGDFWIDGTFVGRSDHETLRDLVSIGRPMMFKGMCWRVEDCEVEEAKRYVAKVSGVSVERLGEKR